MTTTPSADETRLASIRQRAYGGMATDGTVVVIQGEPDTQFLLRLLDASRAHLAEEHDLYLQAVADGIAVSKRAAAAEERASALAAALASARAAIASAPDETWGINSNGAEGPAEQSWPIKDELLHYIDAALSPKAESNDNG